MRPAVVYFLSSLLILALFASSSSASNPRISLKVERATASEAVAAISKAADITITFQPSFGTDGPSPGQEERRASFDWNNIPLSQVLREAAQAYGLRLQSSESHYFLHFASTAPREPEPLARIDRGDFRLSVRQITTETVRRSDPGPDLTVSNYGQMMVVFEAQMLKVEGTPLAGVTNITAKDEFGNILVPDYGRVFRASGRDLYPDEWRGGITLTGPHPAARKLAWIEGDVVRHRVYEPVRVEIPLPLPETGASKTAGVMTVQISQLLRTPEEAGGQLGSINGPRMVFRALTPQGTALHAPNGEYTVTPEVVGASGRRYRAYQSFSNGGQVNADNLLQRDFTALLPTIAEPVEYAVFSQIHREGTIRMARFRMENVPLPTDVPLLPPRVGNPANGKAEDERRFYDRDGGTLVSKVMVAGRPAGEGTLWIGLAADRPEAEGRVEWYEQPVDAQGVARLSHLRPDVYRVLRIYHPKEPGWTGGLGQWRNSEVVGEITAKRDTELPALRWEAARRR